MATWLIEQTFLISTLLALLLLSKGLLARHLSALTQYLTWSIIPVSLLLGSLIDSSQLPAPLYKFVVTASKSSQDLVAVIELSDIALAIWALGAIALLSTLLMSHVKFYQRQKLGQQKIQKRHLNGQDYYTKTSANYASPFVVGFVSPAIVLPADFTERYTGQQQELILRHEQVHKVRGDIWWNLLAQMMVILFWFNPLIWVAYKHFRQVQELACDEAVIANKTSSLKAEYANALLSTSTSNEFTPHLIHYGDKSMLKDRLTRIMTRPNAKGWKNILALFALSCATLTATLVTAGSNTSKEVSAIPLTRIEPFYPPQAAAQKLEGSVTLEYGIKADGTVTDVKVVDSMPKGVFDRNAKIALRQWVYESPGKHLDGMRVQLDFVLSEKSSENAWKKHDKETELVLVENHNE